MEAGTKFQALNTINNPAEGASLTKSEREALKRRTRKQKAKERKMDCYLCRKRGHSIQNCPRNATPTNCYRCGSLEHSVDKCLVKQDKKNPYPFALCFNCNQKGHLIGQCPENERGLYPNGGCCRFCGSVRHLQKDCKPLEQKDGIDTLGLIDLEQGGDDDDIFLALHKKEKVNVLPAKKKKVVQF